MGQRRLPEQALTSHPGLCWNLPDCAEQSGVGTKQEELRGGGGGADSWVASCLSCTAQHWSHLVPDSFHNRIKCTNREAPSGAQWSRDMSGRTAGPRKARKHKHSLAACPRQLWEAAPSFQLCPAAPDDGRKSCFLPPP